MGRKRRASRPPEASSTRERLLGLWVPDPALLVTVLALTVVVAHSFRGVILSDEGVTALGAWRVTRGEIPHRDFFSLITPLSFYYTGAFFRLFGVSLVAERVAGGALGAGMVLLAFTLARHYMKRPVFQALPVAFLCQAGFPAWPFPSHHWMANVLGMGAVLAGLSATFAGERTAVRAALGGCLAGLAFWSLQDEGLYLLVGGVTALAFASPRGERLRAALAWTGGAAVASLPFFVLLGFASPGRVWSDLVLYPLTRYHDAPGNRLGFLQPVTQIVHQFTEGRYRAAPVYSLLVSVTSLTVVAAFLAAPFLFMWLWNRRKDERPALAWLAVLVFAFSATALRRWGPINLQWAILPSALVAALALAESAAVRGSAVRRRWPAVVAGLLVAAFAAVGLYGLWKFAAGEARPIRTPAGTLRTFSAVEARDLQELFDAIAARIPPGESVLFREMPTLNFLALRPSPIPYDLFFPPHTTTKEQVEESLRILDAKGTTWIVTMAFQPTDQPFDRYLADNYTATWVSHAFGLFHRNPARPGRQASSGRD